MSEHYCLNCKNCEGVRDRIIIICSKDALPEYLESPNEKCEHWEAKEESE